MNDTVEKFNERFDKIEKLEKRREKRASKKLETLSSKWDKN